MPNLNVAVLGSPGFSKELGKKGTVSDVTMYNMKRGDSTVTIMEPSSYPEKLVSLFYTVGFADMAVLVVEQVNAALGETILMLDTIGVKKGVVILRNYVQEDRIRQIARGTTVDGYMFMEDDFPKLREMLYEYIQQPKQPESDTGVVAVDHFFNVRGIGPVALGIVKMGQIHKHDKLVMHPTDKVAQVRSIQKHDSDFDVAGVGDRVGLALKNIEASDLDRGIVLSNDDMKRTTEVSGELELVKYWTNPVEEGMAVHVGYWMQFIPAKITGVDKNMVTVHLEKPLAHPEGARGTVMYLNGGNLRVMGSIQL